MGKRCHIVSLPPKNNTYRHVVDGGFIDLALKGKHGLHISLDIVKAKGQLYIDQNVSWNELFASNAEIRHKPT